MKNSTKRSSFVKIENVKGVIFFQSDYKPRFITVEVWEAKGKPPDCFVYDGANQLLAAGIPIVDAIELEGRWIRCEIPTNCPSTKYYKHPSLIRKRVRTSEIPMKAVEFITNTDTMKRKLR